MNTWHLKSHRFLHPPKYHDITCNWLNCMNDKIAMNSMPRSEQHVWSLQIDQSHVTIAIWWPLGVTVVSVTCMRVRWVSHTWKYTRWNTFLLESSHKSPYWKKSLSHGIKIWSIIKFLYLFWTMSQWHLHFTSHSCTYLSKLPAHRA